MAVLFSILIVDAGAFVFWICGGELFSGTLPVLAMATVAGIGLGGLQVISD